MLPNQSNFVKHLEAVAKHAYLASFVVVPTHWNFFQLQSGFLRQVEQFDIESKTIDRRCLNYRSANAHAKCFETTLRIPKGKTGCDSHGKVEDAATLFSTPRLMNSN